MPRLAPEDRERLRLIHEAGGRLHIVTARYRERFPDQAALVRWAETMCRSDYMRLERKKGDANDPTGEVFFDYILTKKAERLASQE